MRYVTMTVTAAFVVLLLMATLSGCATANGDGGDRVVAPAAPAPQTYDAAGAPDGSDAVLIVLPCWENKEQYAIYWQIDTTDPEAANHELNLLRGMWAGTISPEAFIEGIAEINEIWRSSAIDMVETCYGDQFYTEPGATSARVDDNRVDNVDLKG